MKQPQPTKIKNVLNWDYQINKNHLKKDDVQKWILERQLNYGGDARIKLRALLKFWPNVRIEDPIFKEMISNFLQSNYAKRLIKKQKISCAD